MKKTRLDELLVLRGLAASRAQAKALVMSGRVRLGTERLDKPGREFALEAAIEVEQPPRFVSRGGEKLAGALERFALDVRGLHVLDVGASTGGFTDCVLQAGAADVVCVDVGRAQLHAKLRGDSRVTNLEKVNARFLSAKDLPRAAVKSGSSDSATFMRKVPEPHFQARMRSRKSASSACTSMG